MKNKQRRLIFRAWDKLNKVMYANPFNGKFGGMNDIFANTGDWIYMQYTGKTDKDDNEIYEGDVLRYVSKQGYSSSGIYFVAWDEEDCAFVCERESPYNFLHSDLWCECEIVGNIYEPPKLAEK